MCLFFSEISLLMPGWVQHKWEPWIMLNVIDSVCGVLTTVSISIGVSENSFHLFHLFSCFIHHDSHLMEFSWIICSAVYLCKMCKLSKRKKNTKEWCSSLACEIWSYDFSFLNRQGRFFKLLSDIHMDWRHMLRPWSSATREGILCSVYLLTTGHGIGDCDMWLWHHFRGQKIWPDVSRESR